MRTDYHNGDTLWNIFSYIQTDGHVLRWTDIYLNGRTSNRTDGHIRSDGHVLGWTDYIWTDVHMLGLTDIYIPVSRGAGKTSGKYFKAWGWEDIETAYCFGGLRTKVCVVFVLICRHAITRLCVCIHLEMHVGSHGAHAFFHTHREVNVRV